MTKYSLRTRMMSLILVPVLLVGTLVSISFISYRYYELKSLIVRSGISIIEPLSIASEVGINLENHKRVKTLINSLHRRNSEIVRAIAIFDEQHKLFDISNNKYDVNLLRLSPGEPIPTTLSKTEYSNSIILRMPIISETLSSHQWNNSANNNAQPIGYIAIDLDLRAAQLQQYKEIATSIILLILCLGGTALFAYVLVRKVTQPLDCMVKAVDRIRQGQVNSRVTGAMPGELAALQNGINTVAESLSKYKHEMQLHIDQATSDLQITMEQLEIQNVELTIAKKRAQEAVRIKTEFLANMSHELRTPLNGVIGFTRQMLKTPITPQQMEYLYVIDRSANNLLKIINDILEFSRLESNKLVLDQVPFLLRDTVNDVIKLLTPTASAKNLPLYHHIDEKLPNLMMGDPIRLQQILTNLIGNAIKFTDKGNVTLDIKLRQQQHHLIQIDFTVTDTGIGIKPEYRPILFQAFNQADASITRHYGGTGLGLSITKRLVNEMRGEIDFTSEVAKGTVFYFDIWLEKEELLFNSLPEYCTVPPAESRLPMTVMAVDDNPANLKLIGALLSEQVENTLLCSNGMEALALAKEHALDLILMDIQMADMDGFQTSEQIHQLPQHARTPIVAVTAFTCRETNAFYESKNSPFRDCLTKPLDEKRLKALLNQYNPQQNPPVIDWDAALQQTAGKASLAREMLEMLVDTLPKMKDIIEQALAADSTAATTDSETIRKSLQHHAHQLHGSCCYSGVPQLKAICGSVESQLLQGIALIDLEPELLEFMDEIDHVIAAAPSILKAAQPVTSLP
ncbi:ATP-binding protein [Xenorhabdus szentirmaii]|uniref:histidine kinase n=1 Tax=Xenorhabdus szentirmaii TaxID=290112 RepID=A0AAW3YY43_9GAMM|nr:MULTISPECIES: ATP-binding protein [unclassified Xenorhabdus]MBD2793839.1 response regulator [Xenorhabdus sp. CUL]MBD2801088.1 response regulator [Xenorhabdus sp. M]MBD2823923.1 response regulator [Xenorhabdus sp. 5]